MFQRTQFVRFLAVVGAVASWMGLAQSSNADVYPSSTTGRASAYALIFPNPFPTADTETYFGSTGDFAANAHQASSTDGGQVLCDVTCSSIGHVDETGTFGNATIETHWIAANAFPLANPPKSGVIDSTTYFTYSFITDTPGTITIDVDTTSNLTNIVPLDPDFIVNYAMAINHVVTFDGGYTELLLNDEHTLVYNIAPGFYQLTIEHHPNSGISPWPACDVTSTSNISFSIVTDPVVHTLGDMDCDNDVDVDDVEPMTMALLEPGLYAEFYGCIENGDFTTDEVVDGADLQGFVDLLAGQ